MDEAVREYIDAIPSEHRAMFDRLHRLILEAHPDVTVALSYGIPTYRIGRRRLPLGPVLPGHHAGAGVLRQQTSDDLRLEPPACLEPALQRPRHR